MSKQKAITVLILIISFLHAKGQDKIITLQNDTVFCRIISITPTHIQYQQKDDKQNTVGKFISIEQVREYSTRSELHTTSHGTCIGKQPKDPFDRWRIGIQGGGAYLLSSFSNMEKNMQSLGISQSKIDNYCKQLRNGMYFGADVHYFITSFLGVGVNYSLFATSTQIDYILGLGYYDYYVSQGYLGYSIPSYYPISEKDKYYVNYIGPSVVFRHWLDNNRKFRLNEELSVGYTRYREEDRFNPYLYINTYQDITFLNNLLIEGNALGGSIRLSFEYYPMPRLSVGANAGAFLTAFKTMKISTKNMSETQALDADNHINMSRIDYSLAIRFHF